MSGLDSLLLGNAEAIEALSIEERVKIPGGLPHELSIENIAKLAAPNNQEKQELLIKTIVDLCKSGVLNYYGDINGWSHYENTLNPFPKAKTHSLQVLFWDGRDKLYAYSHDCLIHRDNFKVYLQSKKQWPISGLLANWWANDERQADTEALGSAEEIKGRLNNQVAFIVKTAAELGYADLLNIPIGGKTTIQAKCIKSNSALFTKDSFKRSWREANQRGLIRIENKEKFI